MLETVGGMSVCGEVLNRLGRAEQAMLDALELGLELRGQRVGDIVEEHDQLVLDARRMTPVGGQELVQRPGPQRSPDEVHDGDHGGDTSDGSRWAAVMPSWHAGRGSSSSSSGG